MSSNVVPNSISGDSVTVGTDDMSFSFVDIPTTIGGDVPALRDIPALRATTVPKHDIIGLATELTKTQVCVNLKARDLPDDDSLRAPVDIIVALDVSGSMYGNKLNLCKETLLLLLRVLYTEDRFGLICYAENATIEIPVQKMTEANKQLCVKNIQRLRTRGNTNMSAAVGLAREEMRQIETPNDVQTIFFLTDGHANAGIRGQDLVEFTKKCLANDNFTLSGTEGAEDEVKRNRTNKLFRHKNGPADSANPITMHCFGVGADHDAALLQGMSDAVPGGSYYFIETDKDVGGAFGDALGGILSVVAQSVVVTISVPEEAKAHGVSIIEVFHDRKVMRENGSYTIVIGDIYAEENRDVVFEIKLANCSGSASSEPLAHAEIVVSYTDTILKAPVTLHGTSCEISRPPGKVISEPNPHVEVQWTRVMATQAMERADQMAQMMDFEGASRCLKQAQVSVRRAANTIPAEYGASLVCLDSDMTLLSDGMSTPAAYAAGGAHHAKSTWASHFRQRSMKSVPAGATQLYGSKKKKAMQATFSSP